MKKKMKMILIILILIKIDNVIFNKNVRKFVNENIKKMLI